MEKEPFRSAVELKTLIEYAGDIKKVRLSLEKELAELNINCTKALHDLPGGDDDHREAVVRLISLARGNGLYVMLKPSDKTEGLGISISAPKRAAGQLQSGHH